MASEAMENLASRYASQAVRSIFIYTREAHPGENYRHHKTIDDKRANAHAFKQYSKINREIFLDDMIGTAHRAYGTLPNMTWIMGRGGFIHYKSSWTGVDDVEDALKGIIDFQENRIKNEWIPFYSERSCWSKRDQSKFQEGLERAGPQAVADFAGLAAARKSEVANLDVAPKIPGNFFVPEKSD
jgi:hypothetical protein